MLLPAHTWVVNAEDAAPPAARIVEDWQMANPKNPPPPAGRKKTADKKNPSGGGMADAFKGLMYDFVPFLSGAAIGWLDGRFSRGEEDHKVGKHWAKLSRKKKIMALAVLAAAVFWWEQKSRRDGNTKMVDQMVAARHGIVCLIGRYIGDSMGADALKKAVDKQAKDAAKAPVQDTCPPGQSKQGNGECGSLSWDDYRHINGMVEDHVRSLMDEIHRRQMAGEPVGGFNARQLPGLADGEFSIDADAIAALSTLRLPEHFRSAA